MFLYRVVSIPAASRGAVICVAHVAVRRLFWLLIALTSLVVDTFSLLCWLPVASRHPQQSGMRSNLIHRLIRVDEIERAALLEVGYFAGQPRAHAHQVAAFWLSGQ